MSRIVAHSISCWPVWMPKRTGWVIAIRRDVAGFGRRWERGVKLPPSTAQSDEWKEGLLMRRSVGLSVSLVLLAIAPSIAAARAHQMVIVPGEDRFTPLGLTIRAGESVEWVNQDTDDHTVVSDDA